MMTCGGCGTENPVGFNFCGKCGQPLQPTHSVAQERKVVTCLFCDLVGFTAMSEAADPEDVHAVLGQYFVAARSVIEAFGGVVEKFIGDAVVGVFGVPAAHEDDAERAVRAGLRIVEAVEGLTRPNGSPLQLRVGINTGEALVRLDVTAGSGEGFLTGDAVNTAARIQSVAPPMGVAVGRSTYEATRPVFDYIELNPATVKGKAEPVPVWQPLAPLARFGTDVTRRHDTPLVGREIDLAVLKGVFDKTVAAKTPQLVTIVGEPGLGKSRLVAELGSHIDGMTLLVTWRQGRCLPYGEGITFWALGEVVKAHAGILETDAPQVALTKLDAVLPDVEDRAWLRQRLLPLLGMEASSQAEQQELFTAWRRFIESIAETHPTVVAFEDLHWADPAMLAFLEHLAGHATGVPLLVIGTARPELFERHPMYAAGLRNTTTINLTPLTEEETTRLVASLLETFAVPDELRLPLVERAGGNPLFAEEYVRLLQDQDLIERVDDQVQLRYGAVLPLPDNVHALIAARLDTLPPERKALLADAAVVGKVFWAGAVAAMSGIAKDEVVEVMRELAMKELVRPARHSSMAGQTEYSFGHALARDVAYEQLPRASRAARHVAAAEWIETEAGQRVEDLADVLAYHYTTALDLARAAGDDVLAGQVETPAVRFLILAADRVLGLDPATALTYAQRAQALTPPGHPMRAQALAVMGKAAMHTDVALAQASLEEAADLFERVTDLAAVIDTLGALIPAMELHGDQRWSTVGPKMLALVEPHQPGPLHVTVHSHLANRSGILQDYMEAIEHGDRALALARQLGLDTPRDALAARGLARMGLGDSGGLDDVHEGLALSIAAGQGVSVAMVYNNVAYMSLPLQGPLETLSTYREGIAFADAHGLTGLRDLLTASSLENLLAVGNVDEVINTAERLAPRLLSADQQFSLQDVRSALGRALMIRGEAERAISWLDWLQNSGRDTDDPEEAAIGLGTAACLHAALGQDEAATTLFGGLTARRDVCGTIHSAFQLPSWTRTVIGLGELDLAHRLAIAVPTTNPLGEHVHVAVEAALAEARGDHAIALSGYTDAAQRMHDFTMVVEEAFALLGQGRCLSALNHPDDATPVLQHVTDMFTKMGARPALAEVETLIASLT